MLLGITSILATWLLLLSTFCGFGLSIQRLFGLKNQETELLISSFWIGWAFVLILLQLLHFFIPINQTVSLCIIFLGILGLVWNKTRLIHFFCNRYLIKAAFAVVLCVFAIWMANRSMAKVGDYDTGLYHLPSIRWITTYPIIPGLGNLHGRLAFNSSYFLFFALLDVGPWSYMSHHLANGLLLFVLSLQIGLSIIKIVDRSNLQVHDLFQILLIPPFIYECYKSNPSACPNLPIFILGVLISVQLCKLLFNDNNYKKMTFNAFFIIILSAIGITIKLSFLAIGFVSSLIAFSYCIVYKFRMKTKHNQKYLKEFFLIFLGLLLIFIPWIFRGIILSGYIAYPSSLGSFNVEWKVPEKQTIHDMRSIKSSARLPDNPPDKVLKNWDWIIPWAKKILKNHEHQANIIFPLLLGIIGIILTFGANSRDPDFISNIVFLLPAVASLVFWFYTAPDPRFAGVGFWYFGAGALLITIKRWGFETNPKAVFIVLVLMISIAIYNNSWREKFIGPGPLHGFYPIPEVEVHSFVTTSGLRLYVPNKGDQCWNASLPCTPYPKSNLRLRKNGDIKSGFMFSQY